MPADRIWENCDDSFPGPAQSPLGSCGGRDLRNAGNLDQPRPGRGKLLKRRPFPAISKALSQWKEITAPRAVTRSAEHMPIGV